MRVFQTIGIAADVLPSTCLSPGMLFVDADGRCRMLDWSRPATIGPQGWHESYRFHQPDLERVLRHKLETLPEATVLTPVAMCSRSIRTRTAQHCASRILPSGQAGTDPCAPIVGCDGARSLVRRLIGSTSTDLGFHERWLVVDCLLEARQAGSRRSQHSVLRTGAARDLCARCGTASPLGDHGAR